MNAATPAPQPGPSPALWKRDAPAASKPRTDRLCCENAVSLPIPVELPTREDRPPRSPRALDEPLLAREVARHRSALQQVAQRILRCPEQAEDAVQDAIVALWRRSERPPEIRGWLVRTVIHRSLHRRRTELRRRRWEDEAAVAAIVTCPLCDPEEEFARRELLEVVDAAMSCLSEEQQIVIGLRSRGLEYEEIARALDLPIGTVRSRLNRARRALRDQFASEDR